MAFERVEFTIMKIVEMITAFTPRVGRAIPVALLALLQSDTFHQVSNKQGWLKVARFIADSSVKVFFYQDVFELRFQHRLTVFTVYVKADNLAAALASASFEKLLENGLVITDDEVCPSEVPGTEILEATSCSFYPYFSDTINEYHDFVREFLAQRRPKAAFSLNRVEGGANSPLSPRTGLLYKLDDGNWRAGIWLNSGEFKGYQVTFCEECNSYSIASQYFFHVAGCGQYREGEYNEWLR